MDTESNQSGLVCNTKRNVLYLGSLLVSIALILGTSITTIVLLVQQQQKSGSSTSVHPFSTEVATSTIGTLPNSTDVMTSTGMPVQSENPVTSSVTTLSSN